MTVFRTTRAAPFGAVATFRLVARIEAMLGAIRAWRRAVATRNALAGLSDKQLADIGLHRGEIAEVAAELARGG